MVSSEQASEDVAVQTSGSHRPCGESGPQQGCSGDLTDCFYALLEGEDLAEVLFEFLVPAERPQ